MRAYRYVGPPAILERVRGQPAGTPVTSAAEAVAWLRSAGARPGDEVVCTFTVGMDGTLRLADRHSEHVACAAGGPVAGAGELTLLLTGVGAETTRVTNQSTGFCPEPASWPAVRDALDRAGLDPPDGFDVVFIFRRCTRCGSIHVVKDDWLECACGAPLPAQWNFDDPE